MQNDNEQLEQEKGALKERLKQLTKTKLVDDIMQKKIGGGPRASVLLSRLLTEGVSLIIALPQVQRSTDKFLHNVSSHPHPSAKAWSSLQQVNTK